MATKQITTKDAARLTRISRQTLQKWISDGEFKPPAVQLIGSTAVRLWRRSDLKKLRALKKTIFWPTKARHGKKKRGVR
jgi:excisionase family DNA binding protein